MTTSDEVATSPRPRISSIRHWRSFLSFILLFACVSVRAEHASDELIYVGDGFDFARAFHQRMAVMPEVARWKHRNGQPIEDLAREAIVVEQNLQLAEAMGLQRDTVAPLIHQLIELAKRLQHGEFERLQQAHSTIEPRDLATYLRPIIDQSTTALIRAVALDTPRLRNIDIAEQLQQIGPLKLASKETSALTAALNAVRNRAPSQTFSTLDAIAERGIIRVGTTGDYAPLSFIDNAQERGGIDVDLAKRLASELKVRLLFVATSWPNLMNDLHEGRFDIGMSGISRTSARARSAMLTAPYLRDGKTVIARCADTARFTNWTAVDQRDVRVIVNPGGTNERYVLDHVRSAQIIRHPDNLSIFDALLRGDADAMVTDRAEVQWQSRQHPGLCPALAGQLLTHLEKSWLIPRDVVFLEYLNAFIAELELNGELDQVISRYRR